MFNVSRVLCAALAATCLTVAFQSEAEAQYGVAVTQVQTAAPAVVGYVPERYGLFGRRIYYRPVVAPVATVAVARPVTVARPVVTYYAPAPVAMPVTTYRPVTAYAPITTYRPVTTYRPITTYRPVTYSPVCY